MSRILLVEDDPDVGETVSMLLEDDGHEVHLATTAEQALTLCRDVRPQLALVDVTLPGPMDGVALTRALLAHSEDVPLVVLVTARSHPDDEREGRAAGAVDYVVKPFDPSRLLALVSSLVGEG